MSHSQQCSCESHDHDHHHGHHHEHHHSQEGDSTISVSTHDQSIVGTYKFKMNGNYEECSASLCSVLQEIADKVTKLDGIVGHIKAHLASMEKGCVISVTDELADIRPVDQSVCQIEGVAIVFGVSIEAFEEILIHTLPV